MAKRSSRKQTRSPHPWSKRDLAFKYNLGRILAENGISSEEAGKIIGYSRTYVKSLIQGRAKPTYDVCVAFAKYFDTTVDKMMDPDTLPQAGSAPQSDSDDIATMKGEMLSIWTYIHSLVDRVEKLEHVHADAKEA